MSRARDSCGGMAASGASADGSRRKRLQSPGGTVRVDQLGAGERGDHLGSGSRPSTTSIRSSVAGSLEAFVSCRSYADVVLPIGPEERERRRLDRCEDEGRVRRGHRDAGQRIAVARAARRRRSARITEHVAATINTAIDPAIRCVRMLERT